MHILGARLVGGESRAALISSWFAVRSARCRTLCRPNSKLDKAPTSRPWQRDIPTSPSHSPRRLFVPTRRLRHSQGPQTLVFFSLFVRPQIPTANELDTVSEGNRLCLLRRDIHRLPVANGNRPNTQQIQTPDEKRAPAPRILSAHRHPNRRHHPRTPSIATT